jgi:hypothetical protein
MNSNNNQLRIERPWLLGITILLLCLLVGSDVVHAAKTRIRWDIVSFTSFTPPTFGAGGKASALAQDGSKITLTGSGTFRTAGKSQDVTGGGNWQTFDKGGSSTGSGAYVVTGRVRFDEAPGTIPAAVTDNIADKANARSGLAVLTVMYSDGSEGVLVVSCHLPAGTPDTIFEGITASKGFVDYWNVQAPVDGVDGNRTVFHVNQPPTD